ESSTERQSAISWLKDTYPQFDIQEGDLAEILDLTGIEGTVLGAFASRVVYLNSQLKGKGTVYHEAFHGVFRHLMDSSERQRLIDHVVNDPKNKKRFTEKALRDFAAKRNLVFDSARIRALVAEEILAEGFQSYMGSKSSVRAKKPGILQRFFEMLK